MQLKSDYLNIAFDYHSAIVEFTVAALRQIDFEIIAYRGESGALIAPAVAYVLRKKLLCVRKPGSKPHSSYNVEGWSGDDAKYVIIDDLVASGNTVRKIVEGVEARNPTMKCVGLYLYRDNCTYAPCCQLSDMEKLGITIIRGPLDPALDDYAYEQFKYERDTERKLKVANVPDDFDEHAPDLTPTLAARNPKWVGVTTPGLGGKRYYDFGNQPKLDFTALEFKMAATVKDIPMPLEPNLFAYQQKLASRLMNTLDRQLGKAAYFAKAYGASDLQITKTLSQMPWKQYRPPFAVCLRGRIWYERGWISNKNCDALAQLPTEQQLKLCNDLWQHLIAIQQRSKTSGSLESLAEVGLDSMLKSALTMAAPIPTPSPLRDTAGGEESLPNAILPSNVEEVQTAITFAQGQLSPTAGPE